MMHWIRIAATVFVVLVAGCSDGGGAKPNSTVAPAVPSATATPPAGPPRLLAYVEADGYIASRIWDDRQLSAEEKAANPWINPRWAPFNRCLITYGYGDPDLSVLYQADVDAIVDELNDEGSFLRRNERGGLEVVTAPALEAYADCFEKTLAVLPEELASILEPGDPTGEMPAGWTPTPNR